MGVTDFFCNTSSLCLHRPKLSPDCCGLRGSRTTFMPPPAASTSSSVPVKEDDCSLTGDSFIRPHLRKLSPYQPILPFEVSFHLPSFPMTYFTLSLNQIRELFRFLFFNFRLTRFLLYLSYHLCFVELENRGFSI